MVQNLDLTCVLLSNPSTDTCRAVFQRSHPKHASSPVLRGVTPISFIFRYIPVDSEPANDAELGRIGNYQTEAANGPANGKEAHNHRVLQQIDSCGCKAHANVDKAVALDVSLPVQTWSVLLKFNAHFILQDASSS